MGVPLIVAVLLAHRVVAAPLEHAPAAAEDIRTERYVAATITADGDLRIVTSTHRVITVRRKRRPGPGSDKGQTTFERPVISADGRVAGATGLYPNCCTSYDIPLVLVVRAAGRTHRFGGGLPIFDWHFVDGSRRVAFSEQTVHFACVEYWHLREIDSEREIASVEIPVSCGQIPNPPKIDVPDWVRGNVSGIP